MIVPFAAGGGVDAMGRVLAERMRKLLGQPVIIENVPGAGGSLGVGRVARARPDGYTIDLGLMSAHALNGAYYSLPYDPINDFAPIAPLSGTAKILLARKTFPANDLRELITWLKSNPDKASAGVGIVGDRLWVSVSQKETGTQFTLVPYRGTAPATQDLVAGQIDLLLNAPALSLPLVRAGSVKAHAATSDTRLAAAPDIPTFSEFGLPKLSYSEWGGLFAPKGTPPEVIGKLNGAAVEALADPAVRLRLAELGQEIFPREQQTPEALGAMVKADAEKWWPIIKELGNKAQ
jgi:tripartite-type tricarboxylate transporter receptor subunit TctC